MRCELTMCGALLHKVEQSLCTTWLGFSPWGRLLQWLSRRALLTWPERTIEACMNADMVLSFPFQGRHEKDVSELTICKNFKLQQTHHDTTTTVKQSLSRDHYQWPESGNNGSAAFRDVLVAFSIDSGLKLRNIIRPWKSCGAYHLARFSIFCWPFSEYIRRCPTALNV